MSARKFIVIAVVSLLIAHLLDRFVYEYVRYPDVNTEDWGRLLRVMGFLPTWLLAAIALALHDRFQPWRFRRAYLLFFAPALSGLAGEILKITIRRLRPGDTGEYAFRAFSERPFSSGGFGMPSSHAVVAFGAAAMLSRLFPRAWPVWWLLGAGCGLTRILHGRHFLSDVVLAAIVGWAVAALLWRRYAINHSD
ncbi:MAG TPA: phosphatase PAP2 family protein [Longimicrobiales bacterium]